MNDGQIWIYSLLDTLASFVRMSINTKFKRVSRINKKYNRCLIMGNGPSLTDSLEKNKDHLSEIDLIAVNLMASTPEYEKYRPKSYVVCDPLFWIDDLPESFRERIELFYTNIVQKTKWDIQLYIPFFARKNKKIKSILSQNHHIKICYYNKTKIEGHKWLCYAAYNNQWGMPRAQNIIVAALMLAIHSKYKEIFLAGVDSNFIHNIWVDEKNNLRFDDYHYYGDSKERVERILPEKIHEECIFNYYMFKGYIDIEQYSVYRKIKIYNTGLHSFIDAFEKKEII